MVVGCVNSTTTFAKVEKVNAELFILTYGAIVSQALKDNASVADVNKYLDQMGYNIGLRLIDEFLARSGIGRCADLKDTAEVIAKVGFKMFLGVTAQVVGFDAEKKEFSLVLEENPLTDFAELPEQYKGLHYCNVLCGVIRGALAMVQLGVECTYERCVLRGDEVSEIKVVLKEVLADAIPPGEDE